MNKSLNKKPEELTILVTGGAGFIGSHTTVELLNQGFNVVVVDDLSNSSKVALSRIRQIVGVEADDAQLKFYECNILDEQAINSVFKENDIDAIIHFAAFKAVGESVEKPLEYYINNISGALNVLNVSRRHDCKNFIFSSSATVYGEPESVPLFETSPKKDATNPYGWTKSMNEQILFDLAKSDSEFNIVLLRYFNPIGAHESGLIGEDPKGIPNNLLPYVAKVAVGKLERVGVFGDDYPTPDGTGVRDYIHVVDLAKGHVCALNWMGGKTGSDAGHDRHGCEVFNLGTGKGSSVLEVIHAFEKACGHKIEFEIKPRRAGDIAENYANADKAKKELNWVAKFDLTKMCEDAWRWQSSNPDGFEV